MRCYAEETHDFSFANVVGFCSSMAGDKTKDKSVLHRCQVVLLYQRRANASLGDHHQREQRNSLRRDDLYMTASQISNKYLFLQRSQTHH